MSNELFPDVCSHDFGPTKGENQRKKIIFSNSQLQEKYLQNKFVVLILQKAKMAIMYHPCIKS